MGSRTITVTLTEEQYLALASAVATTSEEWANYLPDRYFQGRVRALSNAWAKINAAWHRTLPYTGSGKKK